MAAAANADEFDRWLSEAPPPPSPAVADAKKTTENSTTSTTTSGSSWFSSIAKNTGVSSSLFADLTSTATALGAAVQSTTLSGVASKVRATIEENVSALQSEAELYCTEEAQQKEQAEIAHIVKDIHKTVVEGATALPVGSSAAVAVADAIVKPPLLAAVASSDESTRRWLDDAPPKLRPALEEAVLRLSENGEAFLVAADAAKEDEEELGVLMQCAPHALSFDPRLRERRFELVPSSLTEHTFWRHYFLRVLRERRVLGLPPLRPADPAAAAAAAAVPAPGATDDDAAELLLADGADDDPLDDLAAVEAEADRLLGLTSSSSSGSSSSTSTKVSSSASPPKAAPAPAPAPAPKPAPAPPVAPAPAPAAPPSAPATPTVAASKPAGRLHPPVTPPTAVVGGAAAAAAATTTLDDLDAKIARELDGLDEDEEDGLGQADDDFEDALKDD